MHNILLRNLTFFCTIKLAETRVYQERQVESMVDFSKLRKEAKVTHLFIPMSAVSEVRWLLNKAGVAANECHIKPWRQVLKHQVPAIKHLSDADRDAEIDRYYGEDAKYVKSVPAVIVSHYDAEDLAKALSDTLFGSGDEDYVEYSKKHRTELDNEGIPEEEGIHVMEAN